MDVFQQLVAADLRQHQIQQHQIVPLFLQKIRALASVEGTVADVALRAQCALDEVVDRAVVLYDQNRFQSNHSHSCRQAISSHAALILQRGCVILVNSAADFRKNLSAARFAPPLSGAVAARSGPSGAVCKSLSAGMAAKGRCFAELAINSRACPADGTCSSYRLRRRAG